MSKQTLTIELAKPQEWVRVEDDADLNGLEDVRVYAIRKDGREWFGYLNRWGCSGLQQFCRLEKGGKRGPSGHFPFEVALIETPPWPLVHKDDDGWIDLTKTPVELLDRGRHYELRGDWDGSAWSYHDVDGSWRSVSNRGCGKLPFPYNTPRKGRTVCRGIPDEWLKGPPKQPEPETMEQRVARLEAQMKEVSKAAGKGGGE